MSKRPFKTRDGSLSLLFYSSFSTWSSFLPNWSVSTKTNCTSTKIRNCLDSGNFAKKEPKEINVILFFANTNTSDLNGNQCSGSGGGGGGDEEDNGTKFLNFTKATVIQVRKYS